MATRDKKAPASKKQTPSPVPQLNEPTKKGGKKDDVPEIDVYAASQIDEIHPTENVDLSHPPFAKRIAKNKKGLIVRKKPPIKNKLKKDLKAKNKTKQQKGKIPKKIIKAELSDAAGKAILLKNGTLKPKKVLPKKKVIKNDVPGAVEETPKKVKKTIKKKTTDIQTVPLPVEEIKEEMVVKTEPEVVEDIVEMSETDSTVSKLSTPRKGKKVAKKVNKKVTAKKTSIKNQSIVDTIAKDTTIDLEAQNVINMLDLNVPKAAVAKVQQSVKKRRHSIEKAMYHNDLEDKPIAVIGLAQFEGLLPRSVSPRPKKPSKLRSSIDTLTRTRSPYTTRSDSPARVLRNGKHRKLKDAQLLDGIETENKKRRRIHSDSRDSSEISKCSGYLSESESSYCESTVSLIENGSAPDIQLEGEKTAPLKRSLSVDNEIPVSQEIKLDPADNENNNMDEKPKLIETECKIEDTEASLSTKVPEKLLILDQMAQNFNDVSTDSDPEWGKRTTRASWRKTIKTVPPEPDKKNVEADVVSVQKFYGENISESIENNFNTVTEKTVEIVAKETNDILDIDLSSIKEDEGNKEEPEGNKVEPVEVVNGFTEEPEEKIELKEIIDTCIDTCDIEDREMPQLDKQVELLPETKTETQLSNEDITAPEITKEEEKVDNTLPNDKILKSVDLNTVVIDVQPTKLITESEQINNIESILLNKDLLDTKAVTIEETPENQLKKESILNALGLQSLKAAADAKLAKSKRVLNKVPDPYTGTLKTVIKLNSKGSEKRKSKGDLKMTLQKRKAATSGRDDSDSSPDAENTYYKVMKEDGCSWQSTGQSSESAGAQRKSHNSSNRSNTGDHIHIPLADGSSEHMSDEGGTGADGKADDGSGGKAKTLVIPEKASSFGIHPHRLCRDECCYCYGKFGLFDTPCHIAQIKSNERQQKILEAEKHLTAESCLCDACFRHVDRKANMPSYNKQVKRVDGSASNSEPRLCQALGCTANACHTVRRKWLLKMKRNLQQDIQIDLDTIPGQHSILICETHFDALERLTRCALCKRRLARNHALAVDATEAAQINEALDKQGLPVRLTAADDDTQITTGSSVVCKLCRYFSTLLLKPPSDNRPNTVLFFDNYKKRLLHFRDVQVMDEAEAEEPIPVPTKEKTPEKKQSLKKMKKPKPQKCRKSELLLKPESRTSKSSSDSTQENKEQRVPSTNDVIELDVLPESEQQNNNTEKKPTEVPQKSVLLRRLPNDSKYVVELHPIQKKQPNNNAVERLEKNPSVSVRQLFPGEDDLPLQGNIEFSNPKERTPEGWEKCASTVQYDHDTKRLWQELQKPYGNQSSFLRHLILLEKYFRNGELILTPNASPHASNYCESVQNRLRAYDNIPSHSAPVQPLAMLPFNNPPRKQIVSQSGIITGAPSKQTNNASALSITQLGPSLAAPINIIRPRSASSVPPGLISLQTTRPRQGSTIIRMPSGIKKSTTVLTAGNKVGKQWSPTLIPITQSKVTATVTSGALTKTTELKRLPNLVQVMSGGKPYHMSVQDYNRMCAMKRETELLKKKASTPVSVLKQRPALPINDQQLQQPKPLPAPAPPDTPNTNNASVELKTSTPIEIKKPPVMILPKIPKSLTVIPQTVRKPPEAIPSPNVPAVTLNKTS